MSKENTETTRIALVTPSGPTRRTGNRISGGRWARILRASGHRVTALDQYDRERCDLLIALHARRSHPSIRQFRELHPDKPLIVVLTGTDLYRDIHVDEDSRESLRLATRLVVLQRKGLDELAPELHEKTRVIYQSASPYPGRPGDRNRQFTVAAVGHMRPEKDPFRTAMAVRSLPSSSRIQVVHIGATFSEDMATRTERELERNPRYRWLGELPHWKTRQLMARSHLLSITSRMEGSSNVLCEALASSVPVVASRISGLIGTLGRRLSRLLRARRHRRPQASPGPGRERSAILRESGAALRRGCAAGEPGAGDPGVAATGARSAAAQDFGAGGWRSRGYTRDIVTIGW